MFGLALSLALIERFMVPLAGSCLFLALVYVVVRALRSDQPAPPPEESRLVQELFQGMKTLESRIESLETILLERKGRE